MLTENVKLTVKDAAKKLTGVKRRAFMAKVTQDYFNGSARQAETYLGWSRHTVALGLKEQETGIACIDNYAARGRDKTEDKLPKLLSDIQNIVDSQSQADPSFKSTFSYVRISAKTVRIALIQSKGYPEKEVPTRQTIGDILNRHGYRLKKTQKTKPLKKIKETDDIFENVAQANLASDNNPKSLRISIDSKAKVKVGNLSRGGKARTIEALKADDHDNQWSAVLVPFGILDVWRNQLSIYFGQSAETTDFIADCLSSWWQENKQIYSELEELAINLDNGSAIRNNRTQFIKRMVNFADQTKLRIKLIYYPPYHSKYNPIERCWAVLENYWNGAILNTIDAAISWASNMTWNLVSPIVHLVKETYDKGVIVPPDELQNFLPYWERDEFLPK